MNDLPSSFYGLLTGARPFELWYPDAYDDDENGVFWQSDGALRSGLAADVNERIKAVPLGEGRYRLAGSAELFSMLTLHWGDEFYADETGPRELTLTRVVTPQRFKHWRGVASGPVPSGSELEQYIHSLGGGWQAAAGGLLTVTIPTDHWDEFDASPLWRGTTWSAR